MKSIGIDVGTYSIKFAEVESTRNGFTVRNFQEVLLSSDPTKDRTLEIIDALRRIAEVNDPTQTRYVFAVKQQRVSLRFRFFPFKERQKISKSLAFELEDEIPLDPDESVFDAKIVGQRGEGSEVIAAATPKQSVIEVLKLCEDAGIDPDIVSCEGLALANIFETWNEAPRDFHIPELAEGDPGHLSHIVIYFGHQSTLALIYRSEELIDVRTLQWGAHEIILNLCRTFSLPYHEAQKLLKLKAHVLMQTSGASREQVQLSGAVTTALESFIQEMRMVMLDLRGEHRLQFGRIQILGGLSLMQNISAYLTQGLEVTTNVLHHFELYRSLQVDPNAEAESASPLAIGLALEGIKRPRNPAVNFRRHELARQNKSFQVFWEKWRTPVQLGSLAFGLFFVFAVLRDVFTGGLIAISEEALKAQAKNLAGLSGVQAAPSKVESYINKEKVEIRNLQALEKLNQYKSALDILQTLSDKMPSHGPIQNKNFGLDITKLSVQNDDLTIEGTLLASEHVSFVEEALKQIATGGKIEKIQPQAGVAAPAGSSRFAYKMKVLRL